MNLKDLLDQVKIDTTFGAADEPVAGQPPILAASAVLIPDEAIATATLRHWLAAALTNSNYSFRLAATNALLEFAPEVLTNAPAK